MRSWISGGTRGLRVAPRWAPKTVFAAVACMVATGAASGGRTHGEMLEHASRSFDDAQFRRDARAIAYRLEPDMIYIAGSGRIGGSREFLAAFSTPGTSFEPFVITDRRVFMLRPDVGVVTAEGRISGRDADGEFHDHFRYSDTFRLHSGEWRVAYVQVTRIQ